MNKYIKYLLLGFSMLMLPVMDANGKGFSSSRSGGFSSSRSSGFSSSRSSSSSKPSSSGFSSSKPSAVKPSSGFSSSSSKPSSSGSVSKPNVAPKSAFEIAQQRKALTPPPPKDKFVSEFKQKSSSKYPTTFSTPPATRPNYIPPVTTYNGKQREIEYNPQTRSYGFFDDLGKFMVYDAITDIALGAFQKEEKVYIQTSEQLKKDEETAKVNEYKEKEKEEDNFIFWIVFGTMLIFVVFIGIGKMIFD